MVALSQKQKETAGKIISVGKELGFSNRNIRIAVQVAFIETSLGANKGKNPKSTALGLYQYLDGSWKVHKGERTNDEDSIHAFYKDLAGFEKRYLEHQDLRRKDPQAYAKRDITLQVPAHITYEEYVYIKHHDGAYSSVSSFVRDGKDMDKAINIYASRKDAEEVTENIFRELEKPAAKSLDTIIKEKKRPVSVRDNTRQWPYSPQGPTGSDVSVTSYTRSTGDVKSHTRTRPDGNPTNNRSR